MLSDSTIQQKYSASHVSNDRRNSNFLVIVLGFPSGSEESACNVGKVGSIPGLGSVSLGWRRKWLPAPVFWPEEFH